MWEYMRKNSPKKNATVVISWGPDHWFLVALNPLKVE